MLLIIIYSFGIVMNTLNKGEEGMDEHWGNVRASMLISF